MDRKSKVIGGVAATATAAAVVAATAMWLKNKKAIPDGVTAVSPFKADRYLGKWNEIARFDYKFEKNLTHATAEYSLNEDGSIRVINSGYNVKKNKWEEVTGKAVFAGEPDHANLKVSFFGPFYSGYNVVDIDPDYKYALVFGKNRNYMWILSRETTIPQQTKERFLNKAKEAGYDLDKLIWA